MACTVVINRPLIISFFIISEKYSPKNLDTIQNLCNIAPINSVNNAPNIQKTNESGARQTAKKQTERIHGETNRD
jgi:hypothetical protein